MKEKWKNLKKRLYNSPRQLPHRGKISRFLRISRGGQRATEHRNNFCKESSGQFYQVAREVSEDRDWIDVKKKGRKRIISLTEKGENIYHILKEAPDPEIELEILGKKLGKIELELEGVDIPKRAKWEILLHIFQHEFCPPTREPHILREYIHNLPKNSALRINKDTPDSEDFPQIFPMMIKFFREKSMDKKDYNSQKRPGVGWLITPNMYLSKGLRFEYSPKGNTLVPTYTDESDKWIKKYEKYWKNQLERAMEEIAPEKLKPEKNLEGHVPLSSTSTIPENLPGLMREWREIDETKRENLEIEKYIPEWLMDLLEDDKERKWTCQRLDEEPNFFMPGPFWEQLGFDIEQDYEWYPLAHPYDSKAKPKFVNFYMGMKNLLDYIREIWEKGEKEKAYCTAIEGLGTLYSETGFYEAWKLLRKKPKNQDKKDFKDFKIFQPLEEGLWRPKNKKIDLPNIYRNLIEGEPMEKIREEIRNGKFDLEEVKPTLSQVSKSWTLGKLSD